jgi:hypothetical protein
MYPSKVFRRRQTRPRLRNFAKSFKKLYSFAGLMMRPGFARKWRRKLKKKRLLYVRRNALVRGRGPNGSRGPRRSGTLRALAKRRIWAASKGMSQIADLKVEIKRTIS